MLFTGATFYLERTYVSVAVVNVSSTGRSYDVFVDRHRNMRYDPCKPQPFTTDPACYDLEPPAAIPAGSSAGTRRRGARDGSWPDHPREGPRG